MFYEMQVPAEYSYFMGQKKQQLEEMLSYEKRPDARGNAGKGRKKAAVHEPEARNRPGSVKLILDVMI